MNSVLSMMGEILLPKITNIVEFSKNQVNDHTIEMIDSLIRDSSKIVQSLEYLDIKVLSPKEAYEGLAAAGSTSMKVEISKYSFYKIEIIFRVRSTGELITKKLAIPYLDDYSRLISSDIFYNIKPIFTDSVISPHSRGIFTKLHITKTDISSISYIISINGNRENLSVIYSDINKNVTANVENPVLAKVKTPIAFYVLSTYGLRKAISMVSNATIKSVDMLTYQHDTDDGIYYTDPNSNSTIGFVVNIKERIDVIDNIISSMFYILKHVPTRCTELHQYLDSDNVIDEISFWTFQFGRFYYKGGMTIDKSTLEINAHLDRVKYYIDSISRKDLASIDIHVDGYVDLMLALLDRYNMIILKHKDINADIEQHKNLKVLYYILNKVIIGVNSSFLEIAKREKLKGGLLDKKALESTLGNHIREKMIYSITQSNKKNLAIVLANGCTDNLLNYTLVSDDQNRGNGVYVSSNNSFPSCLRNITPLHFVVGCMHNITKKAPTPLLRLSPFTIVVNTKFVIDDDLTHQTRECHNTMKRITQYSNHTIDEAEIENEDD